MINDALESVPPPMLTPTKIGLLLHRSRLRHQLSQPEAARRAGVSTRLWSEVERGTRPNVSFTTMVRMGTVVDVVLEASATPALGPSRLSARQIAALRDDVRRAAEYGVDIARLREGLDVSPREHAERNDEALAFFQGVRVTRGWHPQRVSSTKRRERARR